MGICFSEVEHEVVEGPPGRYLYHGPPMEHIFVNVIVKSKSKITLGTRRCFTSNTDSVYPYFAEQYNLGYRFLEFLPFPYAIAISGFRTTKQEYQGIFYKDPTDEPGNLWQFHVEQASHYTESKFSMEGFHRKMITTYDMSDLFAKMNERTKCGGRYLGLTQTGLDTNNHGIINVKIKGEVYVDLLFEIPRGPPQETYIYRTLSQQVETKIKLTRLKSDFDSWSVVDNHLAQGWRLITAFMDMDTYNLEQLRSHRIDRNVSECLYVFEKPSSRMDDNSRRYEVNVIEFPYKLASGMNTIKALSMWDATIENMGRQGWHITTILPTPTIKNSTFGMTSIVLLYFQRKVS